MDENKEVMLPEKKSGAWKNVLIVILLLAVIGLAGYICYDKLIKEEPKTEEKEEEKLPVKEQEEEKPAEEVKELKVDAAKANEKLEQLNLALHYALDYVRVNGVSNETNWFLPKNIKYNTELLDNDTRKMDFAFATAYILKVDGLIYDTDETGEEVTGAHGLKYEVFADLYKKLYGKDLVKASKYDSNEIDFKVVKDVIYSGFWSGYPPLGTLLKYKSLTEENGVYTLTAYVITYDAEDDTSYENAMKYEAKDVSVDENNSMVSYKLQLKLEKVTDDLYTIKSLQAIK